MKHSPGDKRVGLTQRPAISDADRVLVAPTFGERNASFIHVVRNPIDGANSLERRDGFPEKSEVFCYGFCKILMRSFSPEGRTVVSSTTKIAFAIGEEPWKTRFAGWNCARFGVSTAPRPTWKGLLRTAPLDGQDWSALGRRILDASLLRKPLKRSKDAAIRLPESQGQARCDEFDGSFPRLRRVVKLFRTVAESDLRIEL